MWTCLAAFLGSLVVSIGAQTHSPCPELFQYVSQQPGRWEGDVTLLTDADLNGVWVRLIFDTNPVDVSVADFGEILPREDGYYLLRNREYVLKAGVPTKVRIAVKYEGNKAPQLIGFRLNARTVCPGHGGGYNWLEGGTQISNEFFLGDLNNKDFLSTRPAVASVVGCGTAPLASVLTSGKKSSEGQWPWHASLYFTAGKEHKKVCDATLISPTHVVTAAHCVTIKNSGKVVNPDSLQVYLGHHFATAENKGIQQIDILSITLHPGYNSINFDNDAAVIRLQKAAIITDYVRPVCLWEESLDVQSVLRRQGVVVGLGFDNSGRYTDRLTQAELNVASPDVCLNARPELATFFTERHLCTRYAKGNAVCVGESGSGVVFSKEDKKQVWELRGLVSVGAGLQNRLVCDESNFVVVQDLATKAMLKWIKSVLA